MRNSLSYILIFTLVPFFSVAQNFLETFGTGPNTGLPPGQTTYALVPSWNSCNPTPPQDGQYIVTANQAFSPPNCPGVTLPVGQLLFNTWHQSLQDKTGDEMGRYLIVNGSFAAGTFYTRGVTDLVEGSTYVFSAWIANLLRQGSSCIDNEQPVSVTFRILDGGTQIAAINTDTVPGFNSFGVFVAPNAPQSAFQNLWQEVQITFVATSPNLTLQLINAGPGGCGNDLAIDDIGFLICDTDELEIVSADTVLVCPTQAEAELFSSVSLPDFGSVAGFWEVVSGPGTILGAANNENVSVGNLSATEPTLFAYNYTFCNQPFQIETIVMAKAPPSFEVLASATQICVGNAVNFSIDGIFSEPFSVEWEFNGASVQNSTLESPNNILFNEPGNHEVVVNLSYLGCTYTQIINILTFPIPQLTLDVPAQACSGETVLLTTAVENLLNGSISWFFPTGEPTVEVAGGTASAVWDLPGVYQVGALAQLADCAEDTVWRTITIVETPIINQIVVLNNEVCLGETIQVQYSGSMPLNTIDLIWDVAVGSAEITQDNNVGSAVFLFAESGIKTIQLTALNGLCSSATVTETVTINAAPQIQIVAPNTACLSETVEIQLGGNVQTNSVVNWDFDGGDVVASGSNFSNTVVWANPGNYEVTLTVIENGCSTTVTRNIAVFDGSKPIASLNFSEPLSGCAPLSINLTNTSQTFGEEYQVLWFLNGVFQEFGESFQEELTIPGTYDVTMIVQTLTGCETVDTLFLPALFQVFPNPSASFSVSPGFEVDIANPVFELTSNELGVSCFWDFGDSTSEQCNPIFTATDTGIYSVLYEATNAFGCSTSTTFLLTVSGIIIYIPNAFTPNNDGVNDTFKPLVTGHTAYQFQIFDRWGSLVFETQNPNEAWNGSRATYNGVYNYKLQVSDSRGEKTLKLGTVSLIR
ncbi:MAG: PKD domain-containing protein [Luteibaculaceae bacterium]